MVPSTRVPIEKLLTRLEELATHLEGEYKDQPWMLETLGRSKKIVQTFIWAYEEGTPFFDRESLADLDRQIDAFEAGAGDEEGVVRIVHVAGRVNCQRLLPPSGGTLDTYTIMYRAYQHITHMSLAHPGGLVDPEYPVFIGHTSSRKPSGWSLQELQEAFRTHQQAWLQSPECKSLVELLGSAEIATPITKIVFFGLGRLDAWEKTSRAKLEECVQRSAIQHAAALTMAEVLASRGEGGQALFCYAQDPIYTEVEKSLLSLRPSNQSCHWKLSNGIFSAIFASNTGSSGNVVPRKKISARLSAQEPVIWDEHRRSVSTMLARKSAPDSAVHVSLPARSVEPAMSTLPSRLESARMVTLKLLVVGGAEPAV